MGSLTRHCEGSEAIQRPHAWLSGLLRARNDETENARNPLPSSLMGGG